MCLGENQDPPVQGPCGRVWGDSFRVDELGFKLAAPWSPLIFLFLSVENPPVLYDLETTVQISGDGERGSLLKPQALFAFGPSWGPRGCPTVPVLPRPPPSMGQAPRLLGVDWRLGGQGWLSRRGWQSSCVCKRHRMLGWWLAQGLSSWASRSRRGVPRVSRLSTPAARCPVVLRPLLGTSGKACVAGGCHLAAAQAPRAHLGQPQSCVVAVPALP